MDFQIVALCILSFIAHVLCDECGFPQYTTKPTKLISRLQPLSGKRFSVMDATGSFSYTVGICTHSEDGPLYAEAGVVQTVVKPPSPSPTKYLIGKYTQSHIYGGTNWIFLEYRGGQNYAHSCNQEARRASIMITCNPADSEGTLHVIEENTNKTSECYYLFELSHQAACQQELKVYNLSIGSVIVIIFVVIVLLYLIGGFLYMRFVVGAKGMEQIPNYSFWQDFGNLLADGCNFVCRSGRRNEPRSYKGVGDDQLQEDDEDDLRDDHLLPM